MNQTVKDLHEREDSNGRNQAQQGLKMIHLFNFSTEFIKMNQ